MLHDLAMSLGIGENVIFAGYRSDVEKFYPLMDLCVLLTNAFVHLEGISNALTEAMASGVPVISSEGGEGHQNLFNMVSMDY